MKLLAKAVKIIQRSFRGIRLAMNPDPGKPECDIEHCLCKREWQHGDFITRAEHEHAQADHITPAEATVRRLAGRYRLTDDA